MPKAIKARSGIAATSRKVRLIGPCISAASLNRAYLDASGKSSRKWKSKIDSELEYWRQELKRKGEQLAALKLRRVAKSISSQTAGQYYRADLKDAALARWSSVYRYAMVQKGVKKYAAKGKYGRKSNSA